MARRKTGGSTRGTKTRGGRTSGRRPKAGTGGGAFARLHERIRASRPREVLLVGAWCLLTVAVIGGLAWGVPTLLERRADQLSRGTISSVVFRDAPTWLDTVRDPLEEVVRDAAGPNELDRASLVRAHEELAASGWFDEIETVARTRDGGVEVRGTYVDPFALVEHGDLLHLVDRQGRRLALAYTSESAPPQLPRIEGVQLAPPSAYGEPWRGGDVHAGLELAAVLREEAWLNQITAIDVASYATQRTLALRTTHGCSIRWGAAPGHETAGEVTTLRKLSVLDWQHRTYGRVDGGCSGELDIRHDVIYGGAAPASD